MNETSAFETALLARRVSRDFVAGAPLAGTTVAPAAVVPVLVGIASLLIPGLGQFINGDRRIALAFFAAFVIACPLVPVGIGVPMLVAVSAWSAVDAWADAKAWNLR
jgi:hypothetical protein